MLRLPAIMHEASNQDLVCAYIDYNIREYIRSKGAIYLPDASEMRIKNHLLAEGETSIYSNAREVHDALGIEWDFTRTSLMLTTGTSTDWHYKTWRMGDWNCGRVDGDPNNVKAADGYIYSMKTLIDDYLAKWNAHGYSNDQIVIGIYQTGIAFDNYDHWVTYTYDPRLENTVADWQSFVAGQEERDEWLAAHDVHIYYDKTGWDEYPYVEVPNPD